MVRRRRYLKFLIIIVLALIASLITTSYLILNITTTETELVTAVKQLVDELEKLPAHYKIKPPTSTTDISETFVKNIKSESGDILELEQIWKIANSWVSKSGIVNFSSPHIGDLYTALKTAEIIKADVDSRGTQLKILLTLKGGQKAVFKPKWYSKDHVIVGPVYGGKDRYGSEIIGFYLSVILNKPFTPFTVERIVSFHDEIIPVATQTLLSTSFKRDNRFCIFGKCYYCSKKDPVCEDQNHLIPGALIFHINGSLKNSRSPWQRSYKQSKTAPWEEVENYCDYVKRKLPRQRLLDLIDTAIFDFLIQNGDRHHYETLYDNVILLDNGKGLGNPDRNYLDILAPLYQCCLLRNSTWTKLLSLKGGVLRKRLETMPDIEHFISEENLAAIEHRLLVVFAAVEYCRKKT